MIFLPINLKAVSPSYMFCIFHPVLKAEGSLLLSEAHHSTHCLTPSLVALSGTSGYKDYALLVCHEILSIQLNSHQHMRKTPFSSHSVTDTKALTSTYSEEDSK